MDKIERDNLKKQTDDLKSLLKFIVDMGGDKDLGALMEIPEVLLRINDKLWNIVRTYVTPENTGKHLAFFKMLELTIDNYIKRGRGNV